MLVTDQTDIEARLDRAEAALQGSGALILKSAETRFAERGYNGPPTPKAILRAEFIPP